MQRKGLNKLWCQIAISSQSNSMRQMWPFTSLFKSGMKFVVRISLTACRFVSVRDDLFLFSFIFMQEKLCSQIYVDPNIENIFLAKFIIDGNFSGHSNSSNSVNVREVNIPFSVGSDWISISWNYKSSGADSIYAEIV